MEMMNGCQVTLAQLSVVAFCCHFQTPTTEEDIYLAWGAVIANWDESFHKRPKYIKQLVRDGIPDAVRALAWQLLSSGFDSPLKDTYVELMEVRIYLVGVYINVVSFNVCNCSYRHRLRNKFRGT